jgi:glycosyltransferase involved in cell wall biosynthesis
MDYLTKRPARVAVVVSHPIQHFCPLYRAIAQDGRVRLHVVFGASAGHKPYFDLHYSRTVDWGPGLLEGFDYEFLPGADDADVNTSITNPQIAAALDRAQPDAVLVSGLYHGISRHALRWCRTHRVAALYLADSSVRNPTSLLQKVRKRCLLPWYFRQINAFLTIGDTNEAYYCRYGVDPARFFRCPYPYEPAVEVAARNRRAIRDDCLRRLSVPSDALVLLTVGKLTKRKAIADLIQAMAHVGSDKLYAVIAGDGPERDVLARLAADLGITNVRFVGFVPPPKLAGYYAAADILVHPSTDDPHPLAVAEAVVVGAPVIVSSRVGSIGPTDDARIGINAVEFPVGDVHALARCIRGFLDGTFSLECMSGASRTVAAERGMRASVDGFVAAAGACLAQM